MSECFGIRSWINKWPATSASKPPYDRFGVERLEERTVLTLPLVASGLEFQVNNSTSHSVGTQEIASDAAGNFVVTWSQSDTIYAQRFDSTGTPLGSNFVVNTNTGVAHLDPAIAMDSDGDFVIVWHSRLTQILGGPYDIYAQRYSSAGTAVGTAFQVDLPSPDTKVGRDTSVAMDSDGDFVIAWEQLSGPLLARRYNSAGVSQGAAFQVNASGENIKVATNDTGAIIFVWDNSASNSDIFARRYDANGQPLGASFIINQQTYSVAYTPDIVMDAAGNFVVVWTDDNVPLSQRPDIYARRFDAAAAPLTGDFLVNTHTLSTQSAPNLVMAADGSFVIAWHGVGDSHTNSVFAQRFDSAGVALDGNFRVNTSTSSSAFGVSLALAGGT